MLIWSPNMESSWEYQKKLKTKNKKASSKVVTLYIEDY